jgi:hypothetical protein
MIKLNTIAFHLKSVKKSTLELLIDEQHIENIMENNIEDELNVIIMY